MTFDYQVSIPARDRADAENKLRALIRLAEQLDARTLAALSQKGPAMLANPIKGRIIRSQLGI